MKSRFLLFVLLAAMFFPMAVNAQETFTVYGGTTTTNATIPFSGANAKYAQRNQMIYPATLLSDMNGKDVTAMTFYISGSPTGDLGNWVVSLAETTATTFSSAAFNTTPLTQVYSGPMVFNANRTEMTVYFDQSFHYNGSNLLVQFSNPDPVNSQTANSAYNFYCSAQLPTAQKQSYAYKNFSSGAVVNEQKRYLPRVTFTYDSENANPKPTDLAVNHVDGESTAELSWTSAASAWNIDVNGTVTSVTDNQFTLTGLMMETPCVIKVQADFGGGETSDWATLAFTPTNITSVGSGTATNNCLPTYGGDKTSLTEQIFTPEELGGPGSITGIDFYHTTSGAATRSKLNIYMLYTEKDSFESTTDWVQVTSSNLVFGSTSATSGNTVTFSQNGWTHINFNTPFDYDGGSNVLLVIDDNTGNYNDGAKNFLSYTTSQYQAIYQHSDDVNLNPTVVTPAGTTSIANPENYGTRSTSKSQIRFHKGNTPECPKPIGVTFNHAEGATTAQVSWESDAESFNIDVNGTVTNGVTNPYTLTNLTMETAYTIKVQGVCNGVAGDWSRAYTFTPTNIVAVGEGNATSNALPSNTNYNYTLTQQIFTPEEIGEQAPIKGVAFYNTGATITRKLAIYMVATDKDNFESVDDRVVVTSSNMVFGTTGNTGGTNVVFAADAWTYIPFTTAFNYDGESNVILVVDDNTNNFNDGARNFLSFTTTEDQAMYFYADDYNPIATSATITLDNFTSNVTTSKNQVQFHKGDAPSCPKPIHLAVSHENGATTAQVTCESDAELFNIDIKVGTAASTIINGVTLPYTLENLVMETKYTIKLQADCGGGDVSAWSNPYVFTPTNISVVGEGDATASELPTNVNWKFSLTQQIFTPEELGGPAPIKGIEIYNNSATDVTRTLQIYMVNTDKDSFESVDDRVVVASGNRVFGAATDGTSVTFAANSWTYVPFTTAFDYDGGSNVLLVIDDNTGSYVDAINFLSFATTEDQAMYFYTDDSNSNPSPTSATISVDNNGITNNKNHVRFHKGNGPSCPKPINLAVSHENAATTAQVTCQSDAELFNIDIKVGTAASTIINGVTLPYTLENLVMETKYTIKLQADCGGGDVSAWSNPYVFTPTNISVVGEGDATASELPTNVNWNYSLTQQIFTPEELGGPAPIKGIEVYNNSATDVTRTLQIYMVNTDKDSFESVDDRVVVASGNRVFGAATDGTSVTFAANSWTYVPFTTAFDYDGGSNVLLVIDDNTGSYVDAINFLSFATTEDQAMYFYSDDNNPVPTTAAASFDPSLYTYNVVNYKNQVRFHKGNPPTCPRPIHFAVNYTGGLTAEVTWESDAESFDIMRGTTTVATGVTGNSYTLTNLSLGATYNVKVRANCGGGDLSEWTNPVSFTVDQYASMCDIHYTLTDSYNDGWFDNSATPKQHKLLVRRGTTTLYTLTMAAGESPKTGTLHIQDDIDINFYWQKGGADYNEECGFVFTDAYGKLIFQGHGYDGSGQMGTYHMNCNEVTYTLDIDGYGDGDGRWYLIASPVDFALPENIDGCIDEENEEDYDLYYFDQTQELEWRNYKAEPFHLESGKGYLYANKHDVTLTFTGLAIESDGDVALTYSDANSDAIMQGLNLVGNPFTVPAWPSLDWYWMNDEGTEIIYSDWTDPVAPMQGIFVYTTTNTEMTFYPVRSKGENCTVAGLSLNLSYASTGSTPLGIIDRAMVRFGEGSPLPKFQLNPNHTKIYIPQSGKDYAMVHSEGMGELPVCFKAERNGSYTLSVNDHEVTFGYLHLIDNMTGADIDLLRTPSYSFEAHTTDYAYRFKLVFICDDANVDDESFAFFSNGSFLISNNGEATLQVIDVMGRIMSSESFSGNTSVNIDAAPGVYVLRLISGENVRTQKVVVR